jgi:SAM-dependent methyltransferase
MILLAFPCDADIAALFLRRVGADGEGGAGGGVDVAGAAEEWGVTGAEALILEKQRVVLEPLLTAAGVRTIHVLPEPFYGTVTCPETAGILASLAGRVERARFPLNDFCGNVALQLACLTDDVAAVNATSLEPLVVGLDPAAGPANLSAPYLRGVVEAVQQELAGLMAAGESDLSRVAVGEGERPTTGLNQSYPYDSEVLFRYVHAASVATGRVLEVGCGIGYGSRAVATLNPDVEVTAIDNDRPSIDFARSHFADASVTYDVALGERLPFPDGSFDTVICYEVVEHVLDPGVLLAEIGRILRPGGRLVGSTPNSRIYAYRVNTERGSNASSHAELRRAGVWPWHVTEFDEGSVAALLSGNGFTPMRNVYPTHTRGLELHRQMTGLSPAARIALLKQHEVWSTADFGAATRYHPLWSGFSFVFEAIKG